MGGWEYSGLGYRWILGAGVCVLGTYTVFWVVGSEGRVEFPLLYWNYCLLISSVELGEFFFFSTFLT